MISDKVGPVNCHKILECINAAEYSALGEAAKERLKIILSCGTIDLSNGNPVRTALFNTFPSGITHDALMEAFPVA